MSERFDVDLKYHFRKKFLKNVYYSIILQNSNNIVTILTCIGYDFML